MMLQINKSSNSEMFVDFTLIKRIGIQAETVKFWVLDPITIISQMIKSKLFLDWDKVTIGFGTRLLQENNTNFT